MLKPFQIRDLHRSPTSVPENIEESSGDAFQDTLSNERRPGIVAVSASQYNEIASDHPHARLTYIDDDDGELITVGSSLELSQRLDEPVPGSTQLYPPSQPSGLVPMHIFDIRRSTPVIELWKKHEYKPLGDDASAANHTTVASPNNEPTLPGAETDGERAQDNGATAPVVTDEAEPLMAAFEAEMAKILSTSETVDENSARQDNNVPSTEDQNRTTDERPQIPTENFISAMQNLMYGAGTLSSGVRSRLPEIERQFQNAQRALPCPVGSSMQVALTALEGQARNLVSAINNASNAGGQNIFPRELPTAANTVESLRSMASELGHMGHTLFEAFENELGCNTQGSQNQAPSAVAGSSVTDAAGPAHADDTNVRTESAANAADANPTSAPTAVAPTAVNLESEKESMGSEKAETSPEPASSQKPADTEPVSQPPNHIDSVPTLPRSHTYLPERSAYLPNAPAHDPFDMPPHRPHGKHIPGAFLPHHPPPPPPPFFPPPPPGMGWPCTGPFHGPPRPPFGPPPFPAPHQHHRAWPQFSFDNRRHGGAARNRAPPSHEERPNPSSSGRSAQTALFIGNVGYNVNDKMIRDVFAAKGFLVDVYLPLDSVTGKHAGFGYLHFSSVHAAKAALDALQGTLIDGHSINLEFSDSSPITALNTATGTRQSTASRHAPSRSELQTSQGAEQAPSERRPSNNGRSLPLSVADMCSVNGNTRHAFSSANDSDSSERLNVLYPSLVPESAAQRPDTNDSAARSPSDLIRPTELESRFPPVSQLDALFLAEQRREGDSSHSSSRPKSTANDGPVAGRSVSPNIPGAFPEAQKPSVTAPCPSVNSRAPQQTSNQNSSAEPAYSRRSNTVRSSHPSRRHSGPWEDIPEGPCSDRSLRRRATERSSLRSGWASHLSPRNPQPSNGPTSQRENSPRFDSRQRSIADCVSTLASLGYGSSEEGGLQRIGVYAAAADGRVSDAIDMIEEERKAYAQRRY